MKKCRICGVELTECINWNLSRVKKKEYTCKECEKVYRKIYYSNPSNKENKLKKDKIYRQSHKEEAHKYMEKYREENKLYFKLYGEEYYQKNRENMKRKSSERRRDYIKTTEGKNYILRQNSKRRGLKNFPLNSWFINSDGHHINNKEVIYIPREWNEQIKHNHKKPETMIGINAMAFFFLMQQNITSLMLLFV